MLRPRSLVIVAVLLLASTTCKESLVSVEVLPETLATVQAAVDLFTTGEIDVQADCSGSLTFNCTGGTPGSPIPVTLTRDSLAIALVTPGTYSFLARVSFGTPDIPFAETSGGSTVSCTVTINTAVVDPPAILVWGSAHFGSQSGGPIDRLDITIDSVSDLAAGDILVGGTSLCSALTWPVVWFAGALEATFASVAPHLCAAPGAALFEPCPGTLMASRPRPSTAW